MAEGHPEAEVVEVEEEAGDILINLILIEL